MQVNAVHALLEALRQQRKSVDLNLLENLKSDQVEELIAATKAANMRLAMIEKFLREQRSNVAGMPEFSQQRDGAVHEKNELFVKLASTTSDAINQNVQQQHGRSWLRRIALDAHPPRVQAYSQDLDPQDNPEAHFNGVALPYKPTREDLELALQQGRKLFPELEVLAQQLDAFELDGADEIAEDKIQYLFLVVAVVFVALILFLFA